MDRWTKILATEKYGLDRPNKGHTRHNWLTQPKQAIQRHTTRRPHTTKVQEGKKDTRRSSLKPRRNGHKRQIGEAGIKFSKSQSGQRTKNSSSLFGPSRILDQPCAIHGTPKRTESIPTENAESSNQSDRSCARNNEGKCLVKRPPRAQTVWLIAPLSYKPR